MKKAKSRKKARRVSPVPAGYHTLTPYLACGDGDAAIDFYKKAFVMLTGEYAAMGPVLARRHHGAYPSLGQRRRRAHRARTHTEDLSMRELKKRAEKAMKA